MSSGARVARFLPVGLGAAATLGLVAGTLGALHPAGDSLAVLRPLLAVVVVLAALAALGLGMRRWAAAGLVAALLALGPILAGVAHAPPLRTPPDLTVYSKNLWAGLEDTGPILADIRAADPDLVLLQEISATNRGLLRDLSGAYPHQHLCRFSVWSSIAILSRWPLDEPACSRRRTLALARTQTPWGPVWAGSVHQVWPWPRAQVAFLDRAMPVLARVEGAAVLAGDFNMVPWGASVARIAAATGTRRIGRIFGTYELHGLPLPIDHVLTSGRGETERRPRLGSDHFGLVARIAF